MPLNEQPQAKWKIAILYSIIHARSLEPSLIKLYDWTKEASKVCGKLLTNTFEAVFLFRIMAGSLQRLTFIETKSQAILLNFFLVLCVKAHRF